MTDDQGQAEFFAGPKITIELIAEDDGSGGVAWEPVGNDSDKVKLPRDGGPFLLVFTIKDHTKLQLRFDASSPFWCEEGQNCPPKAGVNTDQILVDSCDADTLKVLDYNYGQQRTISYQVNVIDKDRKSHPCDPIIENGGGIKKAFVRG